MITVKISPLKFYVDFNHCESADVVVVRPDTELNIATPADQIIEGIAVTVYDEQIECIAVLRRGHHHQWVAEIQRDTITFLPKDQWNRLD